MRSSARLMSWSASSRRPQALANAEKIAGAARRLAVRPVVADLNAVSLPTLDKVVVALTGAGCPVLDGSISGNPPQPSGSADTRVYLSGEHPDLLTGMDSAGVRTIIAGPDVGQASAIKMCTAAVYKASPP